jgi:hypothetical protein
MPEIVRAEHDLPTIRIVLGRSGAHRSEALFQTVRGRGEALRVDVCSTSELGPLEHLTSGKSVPDDAFAVPGHVVESLRQAVDEMGQASTVPATAIWLELPSPRGYLYVLPWERLLAPLGRPLLRLPYHVLRPQAPSPSLAVALCASAPLAKAPFDTVGEMDRMARLWLDRAGDQVTFHLFTDIESHGPLRSRVSDLSGRVVVHDPAEAEAYPAPPRTSRVASESAVVNPWLRWICESLEGKALDVAHFISHGYLSGDSGAIALASTPARDTDRNWSRFVGPAEMSLFLSRLGIWSLVLSGPPYNYSGAALRELADAIALARPGVAVAHELMADWDGEQLARLVEMVYGAGPPVEAPMPGVTCWVHPHFVRYPPEEREALLLTEQGTSSLIKTATQDVLAGEHTPAWVAAGARYLEAQQATWLPSSPDEEVDKDAVAALESVSRLLEKHAKRHLEGE